MPRFRVSDLMISIGAGPVGGGGGGCQLITECGGVTELCVENTQGCAFTQNCNCTIHTACGDILTCNCTQCTPCTATCGCTPCSGGCTCSVCTNRSGCGCTFRSFCTPRSVCGLSFECTPTFIDPTRGLQPEHLAQLKNELRATLDQVEAEERRLSEQMKPQTLDEVAQLEQKLNEALEELRTLRSDLERREQGQSE